MRRLWISLLLCLPLVFAGCNCRHEWSSGNCTVSARCSLCGQLQGEAPGHRFGASTCELPKTCEVCGQTDGAPSAHQWIEATCENPKSCQICAATQGNALDHQWLAATCESSEQCARCHMTRGSAPGHQWLPATPEHGETCSICGKISGLPLGTDDLVEEEQCQNLLGAWGLVHTTTAQELAIPGFERDLVTHITCRFEPFGELIVTTEIPDFETYKAMRAAEYAAEKYAQLAQLGMSREQADGYYLQRNGKTVTQYARDWADLTVKQEDANHQARYVYYVCDGVLFVAGDWTGQFSGWELAMDGNELSVIHEEMGKSYVFTRVH